MSFGKKLLLLVTSLVGLVIVGQGFCLTHSDRDAMSESQPITRSIIKVHTDRGVVTLPGTADSWDQVENAIFLADSIADLQMANNQFPSQPSYE
jgi:hypothetical protein